MNEQNNLNEGANYGSNTERYGLKPYRKRISSGKRIAIVLLAIIVIISGAASISFSSFMKPHHDGGPLMMMLEKITKDLNLSTDQKTQVQAIKDEIKAKMEAKKKDNKQSGMDDFANAFGDRGHDHRGPERGHRPGPGRASEGR